jgi:hypothetical protein
MASSAHNVRHPATACMSSGDMICISQIEFPYLRVGLGLGAVDDVAGSQNPSDVYLGPDRHLATKGNDPGAGFRTRESGYRRPVFPQRTTRSPGELLR